MYGSFSFLDKAGNGVLILAIQYLQPLFPGYAERSQFTRVVTAAIPLAAAIVGALNSVFMVPNKFTKPFVELTVEERKRLALADSSKSNVDMDGSLQAPLLASSK